MGKQDTTGEELKETPERVRNERDQLRSQVDALKPQCAELKQANKALLEHVAEFERAQPSLVKALEAARLQLATLADELGKLKAALEAERARGAEALRLGARAEKKAGAALARDDESYAALQAIGQVTGRLINRRTGVREAEAAAEE